MKSIGIIHVSSQSIYAFDKALQALKVGGELELIHILDTSLLSELDRTGISEPIFARWFSYTLGLQTQSVSAIINTCLALQDFSQLAQPSLTVPVEDSYKACIEYGVHTSNQIGVLTSVREAVPVMRAYAEDCAKSRHKTVAMDIVVVPKNKELLELDAESLLNDGSQRIIIPQISLSNRLAESLQADRVVTEGAMTQKAIAERCLASPLWTLRKLAYGMGLV